MKHETIPLLAGWAPAGAFLLKVYGDHLQDAHILDGDYVLVHPCSLPPGTHGEMEGRIVATVDGEEVRPQRWNGIMAVKAPSMRIVGTVRGVLRVLGGA